MCPRLAVALCLAPDLMLAGQEQDGSAAGRGAPASAHPETDHDYALDAIDDAETAEITIS